VQISDLSNANIISVFYVNYKKIKRSYTHIDKIFASA